MTAPVRPVVLWWGRSDPAYSRNAILRQFQQRLLGARVDLVELTGRGFGGHRPDVFIRAERL